MKEGDFFEKSGVGKLAVFYPDIAQRLCLGEQGGRNNPDRGVTFSCDNWEKLTKPIQARNFPQNKN